jgi:hypothetical protein
MTCRRMLDVYAMRGLAIKPAFTMQSLPMVLAKA